MTYPSRERVLRHFAPFFQLLAGSFVFITSVVVSPAQVMQDIPDLSLNELKFADSNYGLGVGKYGDIIKTSNGGDYWSFVDVNLPLHPELYSIFFDANGVSYVGGDHGTLMKSTDQGNSWSLIELPYQLPVKSIYFSGDSLGFVILEKDYNSHVLKTRDGGLTWRLVQHYDGLCHDIEFADVNNGYFIFSDKLMKTTDRGETWTVSKSSYSYTDYFHDIQFLTPQIGFMITSFSLYKTFDGGVTWTSMATMNVLQGSQIQFINQQVGYCSSNYSITKTTNGGLTWTAIGNGSLGPKVPFYFLDEQIGFFENSQRGDMYKTKDGGAHWAFVFSKPGNDSRQTSDLINSFLQVQSEKLLFSVDSDTLLWRSDNGGVFWYPQTVGTEDLNSVFFINASHGFLVGENGSFYYTVDGGISWQQRNIGTTKHLLKVSFRDEQHGIITGEAGTVMLSDDGGVSWSDVSLPLPADLHVYSGERLGDRLLAVLRGNKGSRPERGIYGSLDKGQTWTKWGFPDQVTYDAHWADQNNVAVAGSYGTFYQSANGGMSFNNAELYASNGAWLGSTGTDMLSLHFPNNGAVGYATGNNNSLVRTNDKGKIWKVVGYYANFDVNRFPIVRMLNDSTGFLAASDATVRVSCDFDKHYIKGSFFDLCPTSINYYSVSPNSATIGMAWSVTGGTIVERPGTGGVGVTWNTTGVRYVEVKLSSPNCKSTRVIRQEITTFELPASTIIAGELVTCNGEQAYEVVHPQANVYYTWQLVSGGSSTIMDGNQAKTRVRWVANGTRTLKLTSTNYNCSVTKVEYFYVQVFNSAPAKITSIEGSKTICDFNAVYEYMVPASSTVRYDWTVIGGEIQSQTNERVSVKWTGQQTMRLSVKPTLACYSADTTSVYVVRTIPQVWYQDKDGDLYGDPLVVSSACTKPAGYVANSSDCNDNRADIHPMTIWYEDKDGDSFGNPTVSMIACIQPAHYVLNQLDCNDELASVNPSVIWYEDKDHDTYGDPNVSLNSCVQPGGYVKNSSDCNDQDKAVNPGTLWYEDKDLDSYGNPMITMTACIQPNGYVSNKLDCSDDDFSINPDRIWYEDADSDGYGNAFSFVTGCIAPEGFVANGDDCNDRDALATPLTGCVTGVDEYDELTFGVYPNPCAGRCSISLPSSSDEALVMDLYGRQVRSVPAGHEWIDVSDLADGIYLVRQGHVMLRLIVSNHR